jgi:phospholipid/cholesterol/gamma-HCH transport system substrate-binding protein
MRRSVREALVGFTLLAAITGGVGLWMWLRGISLGQQTWRIQARFSDAAGLAARSPVTYRGVLVGTVRSVNVTGQAVLADLEITDPNLRLARPLVARVGAASLLGGDAQVALVGDGLPVSASTPGPRDRRCDNQRMVCDRGQVVGVASPSMESVTATVQRLLDQADHDQLVNRLTAATASFDRTAKQTEKLTLDGQTFVKEAQQLVTTLNTSIRKVDPAITQINAASTDAAKASSNVRQLTAKLNNPATVADLQATLANARSLTDRWAAVGSDVRKLTDDAKFMDGIRNVSVGLGKFFEELYPAQTEAARDRAARKQGRPDHPAATSGSSASPTAP